MDTNDAVKNILVQVNAMVSDVLEKRSACERYLVTMHHHAGEPGKQKAALDAMAKKAEYMLEMIGKVTFLCSMLTSMLDDRKQRNAVVLHTLKTLAEAHQALIEVQEALQKGVNLVEGA